MATASISLRDVGRTFGATRALAGVSLDLGPGVTGLLGPNGAGKTTLLRLLATALPPSRGQVRVLGLDPQVPAERTAIRRQLGYQPQETGFPRGFTAFAFVDYIALLKEQSQPAARHAEVRRVLDLVGLSGLGARRIRAMSGGQRRRVALAQALLGSPQVLILDEPTTGVDPEQRVILRAVLAEIARTSVVVLSTHQTEDVAALCERVIVLDRGRVRYDGPVTDLVRPGRRAGLAGRRAGPGRDRLLADRHRPVPQHRRPGTGRRRARRADPRRRLPAAARRATADRGRHRGGAVTATLTAAPPATSPRRATFTALAARETRRLALNPVFLAAAGLTAYTLWSGQRSTVTEIDGANTVSAVFFGGFGMLAAFWLTGSMRASEPVVGVTPVTLPVRTAALCAVALVPFACGCLTLFAFLHFHPVGDPAYGAFSPPARIAVLVGQIVVPVARRPAARRRAGPLGAVPGRRVRAVPASLRLGEPGDGPDPSASGLGARRGAAAVRAVRPLHVAQRRRRHGLARVAVVLPRLAARPVRDRGPGGTPARG